MLTLLRIANRLFGLWVLFLSRGRKNVLKVGLLSQSTSRSSALVPFLRCDSDGGCRKPEFAGKNDLGFRAEGVHFCYKFSLKEAKNFWIRVVWYLGSPESNTD